jgi:SanA protein
LFAVLAVVGINSYVFFYSSPFILESGNGFEDPFLGTDEVRSGETVTAVLLGASVYSSGKLSPVLKERVDAAIELYKSGAVQKILVTGDNKTPTYNEVIPVRDYLLNRDIPAEHVFTDFAGFNTYDSLYRADEVFGVTKALIVTQRFHLPRAIFIARSVGLEAYGVPASAGNTQFRNYIREVLAIVKTFFEVTLHRVPHFLGPKIPITGDGRESLE